MRTLAHHFRFWKLMAANSLQETFINRATNSLFFLGKAVRFTISLVFLILIKNNVQDFVGYTTDQVVVFFLMYQFIDTLAQIFYRGTYIFQNDVQSGDFDFYLSKPINPLFRALTGKTDINDAIFIIPTTTVSIYLISTLDVVITQQSLAIFGVMLINSLLIATGFHILVLAVTILATNVSSMIWLYRDLNRLGQFPVTIYAELIRLALFFIVPVGLMVTVPAEVLLSLKPSVSLGITGVVGVLFFLASLAIWNKSLRNYGSASS